MNTADKLQNYCEVTRKGDSELEWSTAIIDAVEGPYLQETILTLSGTKGFDWLLLLFRDESGLVLVRTEKVCYALPYDGDQELAHTLAGMTTKPDERWHQVAIQVATKLLDKLKQIREDIE